MTMDCWIIKQYGLCRSDRHELVISGAAMVWPTSLAHYSANMENCTSIPVAVWRASLRLRRVRRRDTRTIAR